MHQLLAPGPRGQSKGPGSQPERYDAGDMNGCEVGVGEAVVSRGDAPDVFRLTGHPFDGIPAAVEGRTEVALPAPVRLGRDIRYRAARVDRTADAVCIEGTIGDDQGALGYGLDQSFANAEVGRVPTGEMERDGLATVVCRRVDLRGSVAARLPDGVRALPTFPPDVLRCALASGRIQQHLGGRAASGREHLKNAPQRPLIAQRT